MNISIFRFHKKFKYLRKYYKHKVQAIATSKNDKQSKLLDKQNSIIGIQKDKISLYFVIFLSSNSILFT